MNQKTYSDPEEILKAIKKNRIKGVVAIDFGEYLYEPHENIDEVNEYFSDLLLSEEYGYYLTDIWFEFKGYDKANNQILIEVEGDMSGFIEDYGEQDGD